MRITAAMVEKALERVRAICLGLEGASEKTSHGAPCFFVGKKQFVAFANDHHGDGRLAIWVKAPREAQGMLVGSDPERYFVPAYVGVAGWVGIRLEGRAPWGEIERIVTDGWSMVAPKKRAQKRA